MKKGILILFLLIFSISPAQKGPYYQQFAKYKMDIDVDAAQFTYQGKQTLTYTNNSPDELKTVYFHLYWNAFKAGSMMDQRVQSQGKNGDGRLQQNGISRLASIPENEEGAQNIHWIRQNGKNLKFEIQETIMKVELAEPIKPNSSTTFTMEWDAVIPQQIRRAGRNNREGIDMSMSQWYPKIAEYDYDGWATFDYIGREFHAPFADFEVNISIDKDYIIGAGGILENPSEVKGYDPQAKIKTNNQNKATWKWTAKNILDFAWAADKDYTVESFTVLDGPKIYYVYQKSEKTAFWVEKICKELFSYEDDGYPGDEDNGTMAAWYVLSSLGFYQICPGKPEYVKGKMLVKMVEIEGVKLVLNDAKAVIKHEEILKSKILSGKVN